MIPPCISKLCSFLFAFDLGLGYKFTATVIKSCQPQTDPYLCSGTFVAVNVNAVQVLGFHDVLYRFYNLTYRGNWMTAFLISTSRLKCWRFFQYIMMFALKDLASTHAVLLPSTEFMKKKHALCVQNCVSFSSEYGIEILLYNANVDFP